MAKTLAQLNTQIQTLQRQAEEIRQREVPGVIAKIKDAIAAYGLTASELGLTGNSAAAGPRARKRSAATKRAAKSGGGKASSAKKPVYGVIKYRDENGNEWTGRGKRPAWYLAALESGKTKEDLLVKS